VILGSESSLRYRPGLHCQEGAMSVGTTP